MLTRTQFFRLGLLLLIFWGLSASLIVYGPWDSDTEVSIVGQTQSGATRLADLRDFYPPDLQRDLDRLLKSQLWGVAPDGKAFKSPPSAAEMLQKTQWQLLAVVPRQPDSRILIRVDKAAPVTVREGEKLPDGSTLLKITPYTLTLLRPDQTKITHELYEQGISTIPPHKTERPTTKE